MAENRFQKSVDNAMSNTTQNLAESKNTAQDNVSNNKEDNLTELLDAPGKEKGRSHTVYLSAEVGVALSKLAKKTKKSKSVIVNDILKLVFEKNGIL